MPNFAILERLLASAFGLGHDLIETDQSGLLNGQAKRLSSHILPLSAGLNPSWKGSIGSIFLSF